jgi:stress-induced morphogen
VELQTHFRVIVVSDVFEGQTLIRRHRSIQETLGDELGHSVHALSIVARTPAQWKASKDYQPSPSCMGGDGTFSKK